MKEEWKDIKGYEGLYQVSNLGRIKSLARRGTFERILKCGKNRKGYLFVMLSKGNVAKPKTIHRLVAEAFLNCKEYKFTKEDSGKVFSQCDLEINHKNENKTDNNIDNLEWCTKNYNMNYGTIKYRVSEKQKVKINQYDKNEKFIKTWNSLKEASEKLNIKYQNISRCCRGIRPTAKGYIWKYKEEINEKSN